MTVSLLEGFGGSGGTTECAISTPPRSSAHRHLCHTEATKAAVQRMRIRNGYRNTRTRPAGAEGSLARAAGNRKAFGAGGLSSSGALHAAPLCTSHLSDSALMHRAAVLARQITRLSFSVELGAWSCNLLSRPLHLSPTAGESWDPTQAPLLVTGRMSSVSSRTASYSPVSLPPLRCHHCAATTAGSAAEARAAKKVA